jgi:hypothetical protein
MIFASPFFRLQLDTNMHLFTGTIVGDLDEFSTDIRQDISGKDLEDKTGILMRDYYLV